MNNTIVKIIQRSEEIKLMQKTCEDESLYWSLAGQNGKWFFLCEEKNECSEETLKIIEHICFTDNEIKGIRPQFIYAIVLKKIIKLDEQILKDIIAIEENEYFCKKYVLYYDEAELKALNKWMKEEQTEKLEHLLNLDHCLEYMDKKDDTDEKRAVNLLLRIIIKCPFVRYKFGKENLANFQEELEKKLQRIQKINKKQLEKYKVDFFDKLESDNIEQMVDLYIQEVRKELIDNEY